MDDRYKDFRRHVKTLCKPVFAQLCDCAGLSSEDKELLVLFYFDNKAEDYIADMHNMSKSAYQKRKRFLVGRLMNYMDFISRF